MSSLKAIIQNTSVIIFFLLLQTNHSYGQNTEQKTFTNYTAGLTFNYPSNYELKDLSTDTTLYVVLKLNNAVISIFTLERMFNDFQLETQGFFWWMHNDDSTKNGHTNFKCLPIATEESPEQSVFPESFSVNGKPFLKYYYAKSATLKTDDIIIWMTTYYPDDADKYMKEQTAKNIFESAKAAKLY
jgi:hypothetical protein